MNDFSPTEAALEGLRITRERPRAVLWWWAGYLLAALLQFALALLPPFERLTLLTDQIRTTYAAYAQAPKDTAVVQKLAGLLSQAAPSFVVYAAVVLLMQLVLSTAVLRAVLRPLNGAVGYLRLSMDEVRQLGLAAIIFVAFLGYTLALLVVSSVVLTVLSLGAGPSVFLGAVAGAGVTIAYVYPAIRLSLAPAKTFAERRIDLLGSWALTRGRFWSLLGAYVLAWIIGFILVIAGVSIWRLLAAVMTGGLTLPDPQRFRDLLSPVAVGSLLFNSLFNALLGAIMTAPLASAYLQLAGGAAPVSPVPQIPTPKPGSPWG